MQTTRDINHLLSIGVENKTTENINEKKREQDEALEKVNNSLEQVMQISKELTEQSKYIDLINEDLGGCGYDHPRTCKIL